MFYPLPELLLCCLAGVLCGTNGWVEVEEYSEAKLSFLRRFLPFEHGVASHDTFSNVFNVLDREAFAAAFIAWVKALQEDIREIVAIDSKAPRRSFDRSRGRGAIHMISAWAGAQRLVLGQMKVADKSNEIVAIPDLPGLLTLKGAIVTVDAIGCQKKIAQAIHGAGADYLLALKKNQDALHRDVVEFLAEQRAAGFADCGPERWQALKTTDADHGRIEIRRHWITDDIAWLVERHPDWAELTSIGMVEAVTEAPDGATTSQIRYHIASRSPPKPRCSPGRPGSIGAWRTAYTGPSTSSFARTNAASVLATDRPTSPPSGIWRSTCSNEPKPRKRRASASNTDSPLSVTTSLPTSLTHHKPFKKPFKRFPWIFFQSSLTIHNSCN